MYKNLHLNKNWVKDKLENCNYYSDRIDYILDMVMKIINYPKKAEEGLDYFVEKICYQNIFYINYPMNIPFDQKNNFCVHILIYIMKNIPYVSPKIFLDIPASCCPNYNNKNIINYSSGQIMTNTLKNWKENSDIITVMDEIFVSFSNQFPIYKNNSNNKKIIYSYLEKLIQPSSIYGGIYYKNNKEESNFEKSSVSENVKKSKKKFEYEIQASCNINLVPPKIEKQKTDGESEILNNKKKSASYLTSFVNFFKYSNKDNKSGNLKGDKEVKRNEVNKEIQYNENIGKKVDYLEMATENNKEINLLKNESKKLKDEIIILKNENIRLKKFEEDYKKLENNYKKSIEELNNQINDLTNKYESLKKNKINEIKGKLNNEDSKDEIIKLNKELRSKDDELKMIKSKIGFEIKDNEQIMTLIFTTIDQKFHHALICKDTDKLYKIEGVLYEFFPEYCDTENFFICNGNKINKFKTMKENQIKNNAIIILITDNDNNS